jgi:putative membrane protein
MSTTTERLIVGTAAGIIATVPMTALMLLLHRQLPRHERYPLPPRRVTMEAAEDVGLADDFSEPQRVGLTAAGHFAYGGGVGGLYTLLPENALPRSPALRGIVYGLAVWSGSYLGWLPVAGLHPPATQEPARRNALMIAAHVVYGAALGMLSDWLLQSTTNSHAAARPRERATNAA